MDADKRKLWINGQFVEVTEEVYEIYTKGDRKMRYFENDLKTERLVVGKDGKAERVIPSREDSLDRLMDENAQQFFDERENVENVAFQNLSMDELHNALLTLTLQEQDIIFSLFFEDKTETELAVTLGISQPAVYKKKLKILKKLKIFLENRF